MEEGRSTYRGQLLWTELIAEVQAFDHGPCSTYLTIRVRTDNPVHEPDKEITVLLSERDTKRLAVQLLMGVL